MKKIFLTLLVFLNLFFTNKVEAKLVRYELVATNQKVNLSGKAEVDFAISINGTIPAPVLEFTEGDDAEIVVKNQVPHQELSIHWHGILLPPLMDGVPYVNTPPIRSGESFTFKFKIRQHGTYWYHSHTGVQEQKGVYGAFIIHPKSPTIKADKNIAVVVSDWSDENADQILKNLKKDGDYYLYKKDTMRSWLGAIQAQSLQNYLYNEWTRMGGMDLSDVGYDAFLINGKTDSQLSTAKPGEKIRLRIINASGSSYFYLAMGGGPMTVIAADGVDIDPIKASEILIGMAETYDVLFEVPQNKNVELRATVQDGTGHASGWIGSGEKILVKDRPLPDAYATMDHSNMDHGSMTPAGMDHSAHQKPVDHSKMDHSKMDHSKMNHSKMDHSQMSHKATTSKTSEIIETLTVDDLRAKQKTDFPKSHPVHDVKLVLNGDMERYVWHINGKAIHEDRTIIIKENDVVRFTFENQSMMHHPMHLHGHFFRVVNKNSAFSPLKHTVDVAPHSSRTIEFLANEPGEWMLHCHNLYHMKTGMARVIKYSSFTPTKEIADIQSQDPHLHDHIYYSGMLEAASNHLQARFRLTNTWNDLELKAETRQDYDWETEGDLFYRRWFNNFTSLILGGSAFDQEARFVAGLGYMLPFLVESNWLIDSEGKLRLDLEKRFQWTKTIFTEADATFRQDEKTEFEISLMYGPSWHWAAGFKFTEDSAGIGFQYQF